MHLPLYLAHYALPLLIIRHIILQLPLMPTLNPFKREAVIQHEQYQKGPRTCSRHDGRNLSSDRVHAMLGGVYIDEGGDETGNGVEEAGTGKSLVGLNIECERGCYRKIRLINHT